MKRQESDKPNSKDSAETKRQKQEQEQEQLTAFEEDAATIGALLHEAQNDELSSSTAADSNINTADRDHSSNVAHPAAPANHPLEGINGDASIPNRNNNINNDDNMHVIRDDMPQAPGINGNGNRHALPNPARFAPSTSDEDGDNADEEEARDWLSAPGTRKASRVGNDFQAVLPGPRN